MTYKVRPFEKKDIRPLSIIMKECFSMEPWNEEWEEKDCFERLSVMTAISTSESYVLVDENDDIFGAAVGFVLPFMDKKQYELQEFFVDQKIQHLHMGTFLMNELLRELKSHGISEILFYTSGNLDSFYGKFGFRRDEVRYLMYRDDLCI